MDALLKEAAVSEACTRFGRDLVKSALRQALERAREMTRQNGEAPLVPQIIEMALQCCGDFSRPSLRPVINASGIVIHTNLGRVPLGERIMADIQATVGSYCNLEFDLETGKRGHRSDHFRSLLCQVTGAEEVAVVNNTAAALILVLSTLAQGKEVIVSRGELIEIGGSFRLPDIMAASGAIMKEVGTTNRTRLSDFEQAITDRTALLVKAHRSNYAISGFTEEASLKELVQLGKAKGIPVLYDIGSGLLRKPENLPLADEPDVRSSLETGVDLIAFSGDKLLGGPQSGIIAGRRELVARLQRAPLMRALRVGKLTIAGLTSAVRAYLDDSRLTETLPLFAMLTATPDQLERRAVALREQLSENGVPATVVKSSARCGGGTMPNLEIPSFAVVVTAQEGSQQQRSAFAERLFHALLVLERPILGILRGGELVFDVLTMKEADVACVASAVAQGTQMAKTTRES